MRLSILACAAICVSAVVGNAHARGLYPIADEVIVNTLTSSGQNFPAVVRVADSEFVVVWSGRESPIHLISGIHSQRVAADGTKRGQEQLVNTQVPDDEALESQPRVSADANGEYVIVWQNSGEDDDGDGRGVFGQRVEIDGNKIGPQFIVSAGTVGEQEAPFVASAPNGMFVVVWFDRGMFGELRNDLKLRWFNNDGTPRTGDVVVALTEDGTPQSPSVLVDSNGYAVVGWHALDRDGSGDGILAARYDTDGQQIGEVQQLNLTTSGDQRNVDFALSANGTLVAVWQSPDADQEGVVAQLFDSNLEPIGDELPVNSQSAGAQRYPRVATTGDGSFVVAWDSSDGSGSGVFARLFSAIGEAETSDGQVNLFTEGDQGGSRVHIGIAADRIGSVFVVWRSDEQDGSSTGIVGRGLCVSGHGGRECGDPLCSAGILASDALYALQTAVGLQDCSPCVCDTNASGAVSATDALVVLQRAVGHPVSLDCPICS